MSRPSKPSWMLGAILGLSVLAPNAEASAQAAETPRGLQGWRVPDAVIDAAIRAENVPGLAMAEIVDCEVSDVRYFGVADKRGNDPITAMTLFEAASLSKTVYAMLVLRLAERGQIDLDAPIAAHFVDERVSDLERYNRLTPRLILTHRSGLPNWSQSEGELDFEQEPGGPYMYSGEAFELLKEYVSAVTGESPDELMQNHLGDIFSVSSFTVPFAEGTAIAMGHMDGMNEDGVRDINRPDWPRVAWSLATTAGEFGEFVAAICRGELLAPATRAEMLTPATPYGPWSPGAAPADRLETTALHYGLGWSLQTGPDTLIMNHSGSTGAFTSYAALNLSTKDGVVFFANAFGGNFLIEELVEPYVGSLSPNLEYRAWGYEQYLEAEAAKAGE